MTGRPPRPSPKTVLNPYLTATQTAYTRMKLEIGFPVLLRSCIRQLWAVVVVPPIGCDAVGVSAVPFGPVSNPPLTGREPMGHGAVKCIAPPTLKVVRGISTG